MFKIPANLIENIETHYQTLSRQLLDKISKKYSIDIDELNELLDAASLKSTDEIAVADKTNVKKKVEVNPNEGKKCQHIMTGHSKNKGQQCGEKVSAESKTGLYCKTHLKNETKNPFLKEVPKPSAEEEKTQPEPKKTLKKSESDAPLMPNAKDIKKIVEERTSKISVKKNTWGNYEHSGSKLVLDPITQEVIGKQCDDGKILQLTKDDINLAKTVGFTKIKIPSNLSSTGTKNSQNELYDDEDDYYSDIEESEEDD